MTERKPRLSWHGGKLPLLFAALLAWPAFRGIAADKVTVRVNNQTISAYRTVDLEAAKKEASAAHKPIAWIASSPKLLDGHGTISSPTSRAATLHAFLALHTKTVLIFMDAYEENHRVVPLVDDALHNPDPHYTPPTVVLLDPDAKRVLATVTYEPDFEKRAHALARALDEVKEKMQQPNGAK